MSWCKDPLVTLLKDKGYCLVRIPRADIAPLGLLTRKGGTLARLGSLGQLFTSSQPDPILHAGNPLPNLTGTKSGRLGAAFAMKTLAGAIAALGGNGAQIQESFRGVRHVVYSLEAATEDRIDIAELDQFLADADINPMAVYLNDLLEADEIYIITSVIKCSRLGISTSDSNGHNLNATVGGNLRMEGSVTFTTAAAAAECISAESPIALALGIQAVQLQYQDGQYYAMKPLKAGSAAVRASADPDFLASAGPLLDVNWI